MAEKTTPWWRKALSYALGGIRSGFGLFSRPQKPEAEPEPEVAVTEQEITVEEEETALTEHSTTHLVPDASPATEALPEAAPENSEPIIVAADEVALEPVAVSSEAEEPAEDEPALYQGTTSVAPQMSQNESGALAPEEDSPETSVEIDPSSAVSEPVLQAEKLVETTEVEATQEISSEVAFAPSIAEPEAEEILETEPALKGHDFSRAADATEQARALAPEGSSSETAVEIELTPSASEATAEVSLEADQQLPEEKEELLQEPDAEPVLSEPILAVSVAEVEAEQPPAEIEEIVAAPVCEQETAIAASEPAQPEAVSAPASSPAQPPAPPVAEKPAEKQPIKIESRDNEADLSPFSVIVDQVYDGPLDLLLDLIRKQDIDIYDIPIAKITAQFLAYVNQLKSSDVDVAGEFIYTASLLIHIKSKMLLPRSPSGPEDAAEDPRRELVERLLEHERFKNAAQMLQQKQMLEAATWTNPGHREFKDDAGTEPEIAADTDDLVRIFQNILERARKRPVFNVNEDAVTVGQMIQFLARRLSMEDKPIALHRLLSHTRSERALIATFLALLELVRLQAILLRQDRAFCEIFIKKHTGFDAILNEGLANAKDDWK
jgi:segregation and condensation protein A